MSMYNSYEYEEKYRFFERGIKFATASNGMAVNSVVKFRCLKCGHEWWTTPNKIKNGELCPNCPKVNLVIAEIGDCVLVDVSNENFKDATALIEKEVWERFLEYEYRGERVDFFESSYKEKVLRLCGSRGFYSFLHKDEYLNDADVDLTYGGKLIDLRRVNLTTDKHKPQSRFTPVKGFEGIVFDAEHDSFSVAREENGYHLFLGYFPDFLSAYNAWLNFTMTKID